MPFACAGRAPGCAGARPLQECLPHEGGDHPGTCTLADRVSRIPPRHGTPPGSTPLPGARVRRVCTAFPPLWDFRKRERGAPNVVAPATLGPVGAAAGAPPPPLSHPMVRCVGRATSADPRLDRPYIPHPPSDAPATDRSPNSLTAWNVDTLSEVFSKPCFHHPGIPGSASGPEAGSGPMHLCIGIRSAQRWLASARARSLLRSTGTTGARFPPALASRWRWPVVVPCWRAGRALFTIPLQEIRCRSFQRGARLRPVRQEQRLASGGGCAGSSAAEAAAAHSPARHMNIVRPGPAKPRSRGSRGSSGVRRRRPGSKVAGILEAPRRRRRLKVPGAPSAGWMDEWKEGSVYSKGDERNLPVASAPPLPGLHNNNALFAADDGLLPTAPAPRRSGPGRAASVAMPRRLPQQPPSPPQPPHAIAPTLRKQQRRISPPRLPQPHPPLPLWGGEPFTNAGEGGGGPVHHIAKRRRHPTPSRDPRGVWRRQRGSKGFRSSLRRGSTRRATKTTVRAPTPPSFSCSSHAHAARPRRRTRSVRRLCGGGGQRRRGARVGSVRSLAQARVGALLAPRHTSGCSRTCDSGAGVARAWRGRPVTPGAPSASHQIPSTHQPPGRTSPSHRNCGTRQPYGWVSCELERDIGLHVVVARAQARGEAFKQALAGEVAQDVLAAWVTGHWRGRGAGYRHILAGAGVARAWRGHGAGLSYDTRSDPSAHFQPKARAYFRRGGYFLRITQMNTYRGRLPSAREALPARAAINAEKKLGPAVSAFVDPPSILFLAACDRRVAGKADRIYLNVACTLRARARARAERLVARLRGGVDTVLKQRVGWRRWVARHARRGGRGGRGGRWLLLHKCLTAHPTLVVPLERLRVTLHTRRVPTPTIVSPPPLEGWAVELCHHHRGRAVADRFGCWGGASHVAPAEACFLCEGMPLPLCRCRCCSRCRYSSRCPSRKKKKAAAAVAAAAAAAAAAAGSGSGSGGGGGSGSGSEGWCMPAVPRPRGPGTFAAAGAFGASVGRPRAGGWRGGGVRFLFQFPPSGAKVPRDFRLLRRDAHRRARAPGAQMIRMGSGSSPAFQRLSRATFSAGSAFRARGRHLANPRSHGVPKREESGSRGFPRGGPRAARSPSRARGSGARMGWPSLPTSVHPFLKSWRPVG
eukprot:gene5221-biopygen16197